jgi:uroporphyrin-III C-methyltransferase
MASEVSGTVYLIGAGPGDPELLTLKALRLLRNADVVMHDDLVSPQILALVSNSAQMIPVGKRCGRACITQMEINALMVTHARAGLNVVRLKSGDPMIFGRAGEELDALRRAQIPCEVVPGITAAAAAAADLQISLTDRRAAARLVISAGHHAPQATEAHAASATHVTYMPGSDYRTLVQRMYAEGFSPSTNCVVASAVSREEKTFHRMTLQELAAADPLPAPAILITGAVCDGALLEESSAQFEPRSMPDIVSTIS